MNSETDVLEFDFPDYEEPYPPFPDVKVALFDKENSYGRNRDIADKLYADKLEKEKLRIKKLRKAVRKKRKRASRAKKHPLRRILSIIALFIFVEASALFISAGGGERLIGLVFDDSQTAAAKERVREETKAKKFIESAKVTAQIESVEKSYSDYGNIAVTVKFTVENIGDKKISFQPRRFYAVWSDGWTSPWIEKFYNYNDDFWYSAHVPVGEQISFSLKYYVSEGTEIDGFSYNVYGGLFEDLCEY
ncbi:MAG: DUF5067 domain-containing protein [Oscillospiraceae bacterium]|nr:DUF5067 domain-containing protein [Oscillospiraceae bacterium]